MENTSGKVECTCQMCNIKVLVLKHRVKTWTKCRACANKGKNLGKKHSEETNKKNSEARKGDKNHFFGKKHSEEAKQKMRGREISQLVRDSARDSMKKNSNRRPVMDIWIEKYGVEGANIRLDEFKKLQSFNNSGEKNSNYGKPAPKGSGNGWSGWYNGTYFRSLLELAFIIKLDDEKVLYENGECRKYRVFYEFMGKTKTYFPDFFLPTTGEIIEIKPKKLLGTAQNSAKLEAAKIKYGEKFRIITEFDLDKLDNRKIQELYESKQLIWLPRYEIKYIEHYYKKPDDSGKGVT